ncbi:MAG: ATP-binding protein, partial [Candidatus Peribacteraceae bacterium]|nr:ATP-binding protein [Candidatus Peribacteraceae bacterium]
LDAISFVLSQSWNLSIYDSDFYMGDVNTPIIIEVSLLDIPEKFINEEKYGLHIRGLDNGGEIQDELQSEHKKVLTIKLEIGRGLEPQWHIINNRQEPIWISGNDRAKFNVFMVSEYIDRHFSWSRGNPLYSILKEIQSSDDEKSEVIIEALRDAKEKIDQNNFEQFSEVTEDVKNGSLNLGIDIPDIKTTIDFRDVSIKDGRVCLHDGEIPLRLKGKGTKRLISMAIQNILVQKGGILLIDEVEQGLEPDRVKHLVRSLKKDNLGQIFLTTHSSEVITELESTDLVIVKNTNGETVLTSPDNNFQDIIRACPEAGYAKKVIICEGKTEIGICRAIDLYQESKGKKYMSAIGCVYTLGGGDSFTTRAIKLKELGLNTCVFCDSDKDAELKPSKEELIASEIEIFDCDDGNAIEHQLFQDLPWEGIVKLLHYVIEQKNISETQLKDS